MSSVVIVKTKREIVLLADRGSAECKALAEICNLRLRQLVPVDFPSPCELLAILEGGG